ncbi:MAG: RNA-directed DNA polymerase [Clostridia bacterium]|nr:RNA-directed DNA polymerase [Clostridia bacterium]
MIVYRELSSLSKDLGVSKSSLYKLSNSINKNYHKVEIPKKNGGTRVLSVPSENLKEVQRKITKVILSKETVSIHTTAYRYGASTAYNASHHVNKDVVLKLDILHFFDSILYSDVKDKVFPAEKYSEQIRTLLAILCYHKDSLPQGAPSSPAITNIIMRDFDNTVGEWCRKKNIAYTRYCDDMTFSGNFDAKEVIGFIKIQLRENGFLLNTAKTRVIRRNRSQTVTGIVVNEKINIPADYKRKLRQELYYCKKFGVNSHMARMDFDGNEMSYINRLLGKINYVLSVTPHDKQMLDYKKWLINELEYF